MPNKITKRDIQDYELKGKERINNPPFGLVIPESDKDAGKKTYAYDPHLDPTLVWASNKEHKDQTPESEISLHLGASLRVHKGFQINFSDKLGFGS